MFNRKKRTETISDMIAKMSDEECLTTMIKFIEERVHITTAFLPDEETGLLTKQMIQLTCGEYGTVSQPEDLSVPLTVATAGDIGATVN